MKRRSMVLILTILLLITYTISHANLVLQYQEQDQGLHAVFFLDKHNGWAGGSYGLLLRTNNGGETWGTLDFPKTEGGFICDLVFFNNNDGYCRFVETASLPENWHYSLFTTHDGGESWNETTGASYSIDSFSFADINTGWVGYYDQYGDWTLSKTTDGGDTWQVMRTENATYPLELCDILCVDENTCWVLHGNFVNMGWFSHTYMDITHDGGISWENTFYEKRKGDRTYDRLRCSASDDALWVLGRQRSSMNEINDGFSRFDIATANFDVHFESTPVREAASFGDGEGLFYVHTHPDYGGYDSILYTDENGESFSPYYIIPPLEYTNSWFVQDFSAPDKDHIWFVTAHAQIYKYTPDNISVNETVPTDYHSPLTLYPVAPNPFNPSTSIRFTLAEPSPVELTVFDITGRKVATLIDNMPLAAGEHEAVFNGAGLASGVYVYRCRAGDTVKCGRMSLVK